MIKQPEGSEAIDVTNSEIDGDLDNALSSKKCAVPDAENQQSLMDKLGNELI